MENAVDTRRMRLRFFRQQYKPKQMQTLPVLHTAPQYQIRSCCKMPNTSCQFFLAYIQHNCKEQGAYPPLKVSPSARVYPSKWLFSSNTNDCHWRTSANMLPLAHRRASQPASTTTMQNFSWINHRKIRTVIQFSSTYLILFDVCSVSFRIIECCTIPHPLKLQ